MSQTQQQPVRVHFFCHIRGEGVAGMQAWLTQKQASISFTALDQYINSLPEWPDPAKIDLLVVMGGAMSVNDEAEYPWLIAEKQWIKQFIAQGGAVVGLCLGAQLIASALGAKVQKNAEKEIGFWPVQAVATAKQVEKQADIFQFPAQIYPLSWHSDTFALPDGAVLLAASAACAHQAYQYGRRVLAFQFHPESTPAQLALFLADDGYRDLTEGRYVVDAQTLISTRSENFIAANQLLERALDFVLQVVSVPL